MTRILILSAFLSLFSMVYALPAQAEPKFLGLFWTEYPPDFTPYVENGTWGHPSQWDEDPWQPTDWVQNSTQGLNLIQRFYNADILRGQVKEGDRAILKLGPNFYHLTRRDQTRVLRLIDLVYAVTPKTPGIIALQDYRSGRTMGIYTKDGLTLE